MGWFCSVVGFGSSHWLWSRGKMNRFEKPPQLIHATLAVIKKMKMSILSEYEEILKVRKLSEERKTDAKMQTPFECTYERLKNDLKNQYVENIDDKISRWVSVTKTPYFQDTIPVRFYIQAKMLYREGFYEAAINVTRSICEMICIEELTNQPHPFKNLSIPDKHSPSFSVLKQFLLLPKKIDKNIFLNDIVAKISDDIPKNKDTDFIKSAYSLNKDSGNYELKIDTAKKEKNLIRFFKIFDDVGFENIEIFEPNVLKAIEEVWIKGSTYVHVKKSNNIAKEDAFSIIDTMGFVLHNLYCTEVSMGEEVVSAYSFFPDICSGVTFGMDVFATPEAAHSGYYNLPSLRQMERIINVIGIWEGEWGINSNTEKGKLHFLREGEYVNCKLEILNEESLLDMGISFFGDYFFINRIEGDIKKYFFELSFLNEETLVGKHKYSSKLIILRKIK